MPEAERLRLLEQMAWCTLERAMADDDWRAAAFVLVELRHGRNPARSLAQRAVTRHRRATAPPASTKPAFPSTGSMTTTPRDPVPRAIGRCAAGLCDELALEQAARHAAKTATTEPTCAAPVSQPRRQSEAAARQRRGAPGITVPLADARPVVPAPRPAARAQGP